MCLTVKPVVDGLERELAGRAQVFRVNVAEPAGQELLSRWNLEVVPTFLVFDGTGREVYRATGFPDRGAILRALDVQST